jgi:hypothetical protein
VSNLFPRLLALALAFASSLSGSSARAEPELSTAEAIDALAQFMVEQSQGKRPTVPYPLELRPKTPLAACSIDRPLCVHARAGDARALPQLAAFEAAYDWLHAQRFPLPAPDGGLGGTLDIDIYLEPRARFEGDSSGRETSGEVDSMLVASALDAASSFARVSDDLPEPRRFACAVEALAEAGIRAGDPSEPRLGTAAVAAFAAYLATGHYGCADALDAAQLATEGGLAGEPRDAVTQLALGLVLVARRHDGGEGRFVREVLDLARQKSAAGVGLRSSPTFFQALDRALRNAGESLDAFATDLAVARFFATRGGPGALPSLPSTVGVEPVLGPSFAALPAHMAVHEQRLGPLGSAYARIATQGAPAGSMLQVWLRSDLGPRLALVAVRLDSNDREIGRISAPSRRVPQSFLPVELGAETASVLLVVTALPDALLSERGAPADMRALQAHAFRLILDKRAP